MNFTSARYFELRWSGQPNPTLIHARVFPKLAGDLQRIDAGLLPPCALVASAMHCPVMHAAKRNCEFVAGLAAQRPWLDKSKMMRVRGLAGAQETRLLSDKPKMLLVTAPTGCSNRQDTFVDTSWLITVASGDS